MVSAKFLWGNVLLGGKLQIGAKNSNFEIFESALYMKSVRMPLTNFNKNGCQTMSRNFLVVLYLHLAKLIPRHFFKTSRVPISNNCE